MKIQFADWVYVGIAEFKQAWREFWKKTWFGWLLAGFVWALMLWAPLLSN
jgi:hypothetical protein